MNKSGKERRSNWERIKRGKKRNNEKTGRKLLRERSREALRKAEEEKKHQRRRNKIEKERSVPAGRNAGETGEK
jgi:hypothetical protein